MTSRSKTFLHQRQADDQPTTAVAVGKVLIGGPAVPVVAGPCAVENYEQLLAVGAVLKQLGIGILRGGAFKPRTSPYDFQGLGQEGLELLQTVGEELNLAVVSEVMSPDQVVQAEAYVDCFQVGARNMQNFELLKALGHSRKPVILKRGLCATLSEFVNAAEYILKGGNGNVILCERGIRSFDTATRNVLDIASVPALRGMTHLPVMVDPSHATGKRNLVAPCAKAAVAVGADALLVEAHPNPAQSVSDAAQALSLEDLAMLMPELTKVARAVDRSLHQTGTALPKGMDEQTLKNVVPLSCNRQREYIQFF
ncbi:MAG: bifunctional 3-deoxy-7-phosphoheptulonate synthase/chorismate mutase [Candidatus Melainabacteria bacterium]